MKRFHSFICSLRLRSRPYLLILILLITAVAACRPSPTPTPLPPPPALALNTPVSPSPTPSSSYPIQPATATPLPYLAPSVTAVSSPYPAATQFISTSNFNYLPLITSPLITPSPQPALSPSPTPSAPILISTLDFAAIRNELNAQGQDIAYAKIGFHVGIGGNTAGLEEWMRRLDEAGVPFFLKSVDNAQPILFAQELKRASGVPHVLVYRKSSGGETYDWNVPNYALPANQAAEIHWQMHRDVFPPELDPTLVWLETINEVDRTQAEWLGQFALKTAELSLRDGYNWAAFGWASGEPEPEQWQTPSMLQFLRLAGNNPERLAVALHEYSYLLEDIGDAYPYKVGRFQELFRIADQYGFPRPTVLITEWGWTYEHVPLPEQALPDVAWASRLYAPYPEVKGAAVWYLGIGFGDIANEAQHLIYPVMVYALQNYFIAPQPPAQAPITPEQFAP